jgi:phosphoribosylformylglycinamidine synthase
LIKETIFDSTMELMGKKTSTQHGQDARVTSTAFCLSVFKDNAGVVAFDEVDAVCFKVETHNHPSAIEPYGGSATGIGGVIRDVMGTGLAAKPVANTDVFCVAYPFSPGLAPGNRVSTAPEPLPKGVIHPRRVLQQVVAGVRDYGNRMGIPTVNGAVYFDNRYIGNPLVFCGCVGIIPRDKIEKAARAGDAIVVMGGRTGRDGIHGATFSSAELTDTHADEFSHAVQIGNAIAQKKMLDVILAARDRGLFTAITDCGAGGLSSAVGEMGEKVGAEVELGSVPLKYAGLRYDEIWISEAQERMVLSVPGERVEELLKLAR